MWGASIRAGLYMLGVVFVSWILGEVLGHLIPMMNHPDHWLVENFEALNEWAIFIGMLSVLIYFVAAGYVESKIP